MKNRRWEKVNKKYVRFIVEIIAYIIISIVLDLLGINSWIVRIAIVTVIIFITLLIEKYFFKSKQNEKEEEHS